MKKIFLLATAAVAMTACNSNDNFIDDPVAAQISATIGNSAESRATDTSWAAGDAIGVTMGDRYHNIKYITAQGDDNFTGTTMYFKNKKEPVNLTAYYPFTGTEGTTPTAISATTSSEYQTAAAQPKFDFLFAVEENVVGSDPKVKFNFNHMMSKLTLVFKNGNGIDVSKITSYKIEGLKLKGSFNTVNGVCAVDGDAAAEALTISPAQGSVKNDEALPSLILFPQTAAANTVTLTITDSDDQNYTCNLDFENGVLAAGNNYQFKIKVNKTGLVIEAPSITDWNTVSTDDETEAY